MNATVEQRVADLEKQVAELTAQVLGSKSREKNWQRTVGTFPRDEMTIEAERLGREWRHASENSETRADS